MDEHKRTATERVEQWFSRRRPYVTAPSRCQIRRRRYSRRPGKSGSRSRHVWFLRIWVQCRQVRKLARRYT